MSKDYYRIQALKQIRYNRVCRHKPMGFYQRSSASASRDFAAWDQASPKPGNAMVIHPLQDTHEVFADRDLLLTLSRSGLPGC